MRLRLERAVGELQDKNPNDTGFIRSTTSWVQNLFSHQNIRVELEEGADEENTQRNKQKIEDLYAKLQKKLNTQKECVLKSMDGLTAEKQEGIVNFWTDAYDFLMNVFELIRDVFNKVIE